MGCLYSTLTHSIQFIMTTFKDKNSNISTNIFIVISCCWNKINVLLNCKLSTLEQDGYVVVFSGIDTIVSFNYAIQDIS